jgi:hypothetical protein
MTAAVFSSKPHDRYGARFSKTVERLSNLSCTDDGDVCYKIRVNGRGLLQIFEETNGASPLILTCKTVYTSETIRQ